MYHRSLIFIDFWRNSSGFLEILSKILLRWVFELKTAALALYLTLMACKWVAVTSRGGIQLQLVSAPSSACEFDRFLIKKYDNNNKKEKQSKTNFGFSFHSFFSFLFPFFVSFFDFLSKMISPDEIIVSIY